MTEITTHGPVSFKERAVNFVIGRIVNITNRKIQIGELQKRYNATEGRVMRMTLTDLGKSYHFRVANGKFEYLSAPASVAGGFETSSDVLLSIATGKQKRLNPATGDAYTVEFTPVDAVTQGLVRIWGDAASNDMLLFAKSIYHNVYDSLRTELRDVADGIGKNGQ